VGPFSRFGAPTDPPEVRALLADTFGTRAPPRVARHLDAVTGAPRDPLRWGRLGQACLEAGAPQAAVAAFRQLLVLDPRSADGAASLGVALVAQGDHGGAEDALRAALAADPGLLPAWHNLGGLLLRGGEPDEALSCFDRAIGLREDHAPAWFGKSQALSAVGRDREAKHALRRAAELDPRMAAALAMAPPGGAPLFAGSRASLEHLRDRGRRTAGDEE